MIPEPRITGVTRSKDNRCNQIQLIVVKLFLCHWFIIRTLLKFTWTFPLQSQPVASFKNVSCLFLQGIKYSACEQYSIPYLEKLLYQPKAPIAVETTCLCGHLGHLGARMPSNFYWRNSTTHATSSPLKCSAEFLSNATPFPLQFENYLNAHTTCL